MVERPLSCSSVATKIENGMKETSGSEKRLKTKMKILWNFEKSLKTIKVRNFSKDMQRIKDFCQNIKENVQSEKYVS